MWAAWKKFKTHPKYCNETEEILVTLNVFPNPFKDFSILDFALNESLEVNIDLLDLQGRKIKSIAAGNFEAGNHQIKVSATTLSEGVYFLRCLTNTTIITKKTHSLNGLSIH